jgi:hypothetical protein
MNRSISPPDAARGVGGRDPGRERYWLTRHYVAASTLVTLLIAILAPNSLNARAIGAAGPLGDWVLLCLVAVSVASLCEALITDFAPRLTCQWLRRKRHIIFMCMALGQLCLAYVLLAFAPESWVLMLRFSLDATVASSVAFLDLFARHKADQPA